MNFFGYKVKAKKIINKCDIASNLELDSSDYNESLLKHYEMSSCAKDLYHKIINNNNKRL